MNFGLVHATIVAMLTSGALQPAVPEAPDLFSTQVATVVANSVELHADASPLQPVVDCLHRGDQAIVIFVQGDWLMVRGSDARVGWLERAYTSTRFENLATTEILAGHSGEFSQLPSPKRLPPLSADSYDFP